MGSCIHLGINWNTMCRAGVQCPELQLKPPNLC